MPQIIRQVFFLCSLCLLFFVQTSGTLATPYYSVAGGYATTVNEWSQCYSVANVAGNPTTFIPTNTANEWAQFIAHHPNHISLTPCLPSNATVTVYTRACTAETATFYISQLPKSFGPDYNHNTYTVSMVGTNVKIDCYRWPGKNFPGDTIIAVKLDGIPGHAGDLWASSVVSYVLGTEGHVGIAASTANALGDNSYNPYYLAGWSAANNGPSDCTFLGDGNSEIVLGFSY